MSNEPPKSINVRRVGDDLATRRPALYLLTLGDRLAKHGDAVIDRFFRIMSDETTSPSMFLKYLKELHNILAVKEVMQHTLALRKQGRPANEEDPEVQERRAAWVEVLQRYPDEDEPVDAQFTPAEEESSPPPKRRRSA